MDFKDWTQPSRETHTRVLLAGPGHVDSGGGALSADVHLDLDSLQTEGATVAVLHLGIQNLDSTELIDASSVGIELTIGDLEDLIGSLCRVLVEARDIQKENQR